MKNAPIVPFLLTLLVSGLPAGVCAAAEPPAAPVDRATEAAKVREEFLFAWRAYEQTSWGHDELKPLS